MNKKSLVLSSACWSALTGTVSASEPPRQNFECDTPAGHYSYWNRTVSGAPIDIEGTLTVNELGKDKKWSPVALVALRGGPEGKTQFGIRLSALAKITESYFLRIVKPGGEEALGLGLVPSTNDAIPFAIHLDGAGQLRVSFAGFEASTAVGDFKPTRIEFSCSTGDFEFKDFVIREAD